MEVSLRSGPHLSCRTCIKTVRCITAMLPQPLLRFLLADEPGTGKTIMGGLWLREMQRLGFVNRALVVCPAHLVTKWQEDFERFFGGPGSLRRITANTVREHAVGINHDMSGRFSGVSR